jgi:hypothetical protein
MRFASYSLALCAGLGLLACSSSSATTTAIVRPQLVSVLPEDFLGSVRCSPDFGSADGGAAGAGADESSGAHAEAGELAAKSYVATLTDITPTADGGVTAFVLPSSPPTRCTQPVTFSYLVTGHYYTAHVEAYSENAEELTPFAPGSPLVLDAAGNRVSARWSADCGGYSSTPASGGAGGVSAVGGGSAGGAAGNGGLPGILVYDTITQSPHACGTWLTPIE